MFLHENQYQIARKLSAKNSKGYSLSTIRINNIRRWCLVVNLLAGIHKKRFEIYCDQIES